MRYKKINSFNKIKISDNNLILCDIDETILYFNKINKNWWNKRISYHLCLSNCSQTAFYNTYNEWLNYVQKNKPKYTDKLGFFQMLFEIKNKNSKIYFITARFPEVKQITYEHLDHLGIDYYNNPIYFVGNRSKGDFIKNNFNLDKYNKVIFIDDNEKNLNDVREEFGKIIDIYQFCL